VTNGDAAGFNAIVLSVPPPMVTTYGASVVADLRLLNDIV
jgi:hypothetical protein